MYTTKKDKENPLPAVCRKTSIVVKNGVWGVAPRQVAGTPVPVFSPGTDAGRVCTRALHDAKPTKHTQPFTEGKGFGVSARMPR